MINETSGKEKMSLENELEETRERLAKVKTPIYIETVDIDLLSKTRIMRCCSRPRSRRTRWDIRSSC